MKKTKWLLPLALLVMITALLTVGVFAAGEETMVAKVGETEYADLNSAIAAVTSENNVITVLQSFTAESTVNASAIHYTVKGSTGNEIVTFPENATFPQSGSVTFEGVHVRTNGKLNISGSVSVTFGNDAYLTGALDETNTNANVIYGYNRKHMNPMMTLSGTATLNFNSGSKMYWIHAHEGIVVNTGATLNIDGLDLNSTVMGLSLVCVEGGTVNVSGATIANSTMIEGIVKVSSGTVNFTGPITGGNYIILNTDGKAQTSTVNINFAANLADRQGDKKKYYNADYIGVTYNGTTTYYNKELKEVIQQYTGTYYTDGYTIDIYKDYEISGENAISQRAFTLNGNGHKVKINRDIVGIYNDNDETHKATITFNDVIIETGDINIGGRISLVFGDKSVLTTEGEQVDKLFEHKDGTGTVTFETGSKIKDINCKGTPIRMGSSNLIVENGATLDGTIYVRPYEAETSGRIFEKNIAFVTSAATENNIAPGSLGLVARIGQNYYHRFANAVTAANGATVELLADCTYLNDGYDLTGALDWKLDGKGKTLKMEKTFSVAGNDGVHSNVEIKDLKIDLASQGGGFNVSGSYLTLDNVEVTQSNYSPEYFIQSVYDCSVVTLNNSTITDINTNISDGQCAAIKMVGGTLKLNQTEIKNCVGQNGGAVALHNGSKLEMTGGLIQGNEATLGAGILCYGANHELKFSGNAKVIDNTHKTDNTELNIRLDGCGNITLEDGFSGKIGLTANVASGTKVGTVSGALASGASIFADNTEGNTVGYPNEDGDLIMVVAPEFNVETDKGMYGDTYGVVRAMATFEGLHEDVKIEKCGIYFLKNTTGNNENRKSEQLHIDNVTDKVTNGMGIQYDCYGMKQGDAVYAIAWYKLKGIDFYKYTTVSATLTDDEKNVTYDVTTGTEGE